MPLLTELVNLNLRVSTNIPLLTELKVWPKRRDNLTAVPDGVIWVKVERRQSGADFSLLQGKRIESGRKTAAVHHASREPSGSRSQCGLQNIEVLHENAPHPDPLRSERRGNGIKTGKSWQRTPDWPCLPAAVMGCLSEAPYHF